MATEEARKAAIAKASRIVQSDDPFTNRQGEKSGQQSYPRVLSRTIRGVLDEDADTSYITDQANTELLDACQFIGIYAEAEVQLTGSLVQTFSSGGLWGIKSDAGAPYLSEIAEDQLDILEEEIDTHALPDVVLNDIQSSILS